jgi:hypothetical protein
MIHLHFVFIRVRGWGLQAPLTDNFASENCFEKVLPLATILEQVFIDESFSLTLRANTHKFPIPDNRSYFESENGL